MSELLLGVNIDHVATLRNARQAFLPNPLQAAFIAEYSGANNITVHLREDRRHINENDIKTLLKFIQIKLNLEIAATEEMANIAIELKPHYCCLVPEKREEITTEGGLDVINQKDKLNSIISNLTNSGIRVSLFVDADKQQISAAHEVGSKCIEIHTGKYANAIKNNFCDMEFNRVKDSALYAHNLGLIVNAGHGLDYFNVKRIASIKVINELNIGHAIISRSIISGLSKAVRDMKDLIKESRK